MSTRRIAITGLGAVTPLGLTTDALWQGLTEGRCGAGTITAFDAVAFPCRLAGQVPAYQIRDYVPKSQRKSVKLMCRDIELSVIAAHEAATRSGLKTKVTAPDDPQTNPKRTAISYGAGLISCELEEIAPSVALSITENAFDIKKWGRDGLNSLTPLWLLKYLPNMLPCHVGIHHDIQGPSNTITCGEAAGHIAIAEASEMIGRGDADVAFAGGCEAKVNPIVMMRQCLLKRSTFDYNDQPEQACRPFDAAASGSVFGEAAGMVILEEMQSAQERKAPILAEIVGTASSQSLNPEYAHLEADGKGLAIAIQKALAEAGIAPGQIDLIIPTGTGIADDDKAEAAALKSVFGDTLKEISVWPIKSMVTHTGSAAGAIDLIAAVMAMKHGQIGPSVNYTRPADGCELNISATPVTKEMTYALCCGYSFGGQTAALVVKKYKENG